MIWSIISIAALAYFGFMAVVFVGQPHFIYFPEKTSLETPDQTGLSYEEISFETADNVKLSGWFIPAENPRGVVLFFHGNAGNISNRMESIHIFHRLGFSTFIFDYRGYGKSSGKPTEKGTYLDAEAAWRYLTEKRDVPPKEVIFFGRSLGGAIAAWLAQNNTPKALIIESSFTSVPDIAADLYPYLPARLLARFDYNTGEYIKRINCPILVIHSINDDMIPFKHGRRLFDAAREPKKFVEITGTHNDGFMTSGKRYEDGLDAFLRNYPAIGKK